MIRMCKNRGFSLTEVLLSVGILSVGMIFIGGVFPVAIHFTTIATERTVAAIAADEAFAKIKLYEVDLSELDEDELKDFNEVLPAEVDIDSNEFTYPSIGTDISQKQFFWSALCRLTEEYDDVNNLNPPVQVTIFVCRRTSSNLRYYLPDPGGSGEVDWPVPDETNRPTPVKVEVDKVIGKDNELKIDNIKEKIFINDGYTIVDDETGRIYRVLERYRDDPDTAESEDEKILLDRDWDGSSPGGPPDEVWVVPPPVGGGRYSCIAVYQKVIKF